MDFKYMVDLNVNSLHVDKLLVFFVLIVSIKCM